MFKMTFVEERTLELIIDGVAKDVTTMTHEDLMFEIVNLVKDVIDGTPEEKLETRMDIVDILNYCEYPIDFIEEIDRALEVLFMLPNEAMAINFLSLIYKTAGIKSKNPFNLIDKKGFVRIYNSIPAFVEAEFLPTIEEVVLKEGTRISAISDSKCVRKSKEVIREGLRIPCSIINGDEADVAFIKRFTNKGLIIEDSEGNEKIVDEEKVYLDMNAIKKSRAAAKNRLVSVKELDDSFGGIVTEDNTKYPMAWHQSYGKVEILNRTTDEYGHEVVVIRPVNFDGVFENEYSAGYKIGEDEVGEELRFHYNNKPLVCYPCELIDIETIRPEYKEKIREIFENPEENDMYQAFSSQEMVDSAFRRDRLGKIIKGAERDEATSPVVNTLNELVYVVANLPRATVKGQYANLYAIQLSKARRKAFAKAIANGKLLRDKLELPRIPVGKIEVIPEEEPVITDGVTRYKAKIKDSFAEYKFKRTEDGKTEWIPRMERPMVLAVGADTGRLYVTPAWWLNNVSRPTEVKVMVPIYKVVRELPKTIRDLSKLNDYFRKVKEMEVKLDLTKPGHLRYFNAIYGLRDARYKYVDPRTKEKVETPEVFVYNPAADFDPVNHPTADLITATEYYPATQTVDDNAIEIAEMMVDEIQAQEVRNAIDEVINQIKALGAENVKFKLTKDPTTPGLVTIEQKKREWTFKVVRKGESLEVDTPYQISSKAKNLFSRLIQLAQV